MPTGTPPTAPVIVLGMHRSGTSCLAGCLQEAGLYLGAVNVKAPANVKGNRENRIIMDLHEEVLAAEGASWDAPRCCPYWRAEHAVRRREIIADYPADRAWGFKDPRTLMTLEGWLRDLPRARLVGSFRHPAAVARSLELRNGFDRARSFAIWTAYNHRLLHFARHHGAALVDFDLAPGAYLDRVRGVARRLRLPGARGEIRFFETNLRRNAAETGDDAPLPGEVARLYSALKEAVAC